MPECEATCKPWFHYSSHKMIIQDCSHQASVRIDGINLCLKHAGAIAVRKLINEGMAETLDKTHKPSICSMDRF